MDYRFDLPPAILTATVSPLRIQTSVPFSFTTGSIGRASTLSIYFIVVEAQRKEKKRNDFK